MNHLFTYLLLALAALLWSAFTALRRRSLVGAANNYDAAVETHDCSVRRTNDAAVTTRHLLWKKGATDLGVALNGATDAPLGTIDNTETATGQGQTVLLLGRGPTKKVVAAVAITVGQRVFTAANGKVTNVSAAGIYYLGQALTASAADGDIIELNDCVPVVVP